MKNLTQFQDIKRQAVEAAEIAVASQFPIKQNATFAEEGPCGFAWVTITNGRTAFAKFAKEHLGAHKNYGGKGYNIWYSNLYNTRGNQSEHRHIIACEAAANVF